MSDHGDTHEGSTLPSSTLRCARGAPSTECPNAALLSSVSSGLSPIIHGFRSQFPLCGLPRGTCSVGHTRSPSTAFHEGKSPAQAGGAAGCPTGTTALPPLSAPPPLRGLRSPGTLGLSAARVVACSGMWLVSSFLLLIISLQQLLEITADGPQAKTSQEALRLCQAAQPCSAQALCAG